MFPKITLAAFATFLLAGCGPCNDDIGLRAFKAGFNDCKLDEEFDWQSSDDVICYTEGWKDAGCQ